MCFTNVYKERLETWDIIVLLHIVIYDNNPNQNKSPAVEKNLRVSR